MQICPDMTLHLLLVSGILLLAYASGSTPCCQKKTAGGVAYSLVEEDNPDTTSYGCLSNCVYQRDGFPGQMICFAPGNLEVECLDEKVTNQPTGDSPTTTITTTTMSTTTTSSTTTTTRARCLPAQNSTSTDYPETAKMLYFGPDMILHASNFTRAIECNVPPYPLSNLENGVTAVIDNNIWNCGGGAYNSSWTFYNSCYKLTGGAWVPQANMIRTRYTGAASMTCSGEWLVTGGTGETSTELLSGGTWRAGPTLEESESFRCQVTLGDTVYLTGGNSARGPSKRTFSLSIGDTAWTRLADMNTGRYGHSCIVYGEDMLVLAGVTVGRSNNEVERYKPSTNTWSNLPNLPARIWYGQAGIVGNTVWTGYSSIYTTTDLVTWTKIDVSGFSVGSRPVFPAPLVTPDVLNC